MMCPSLPLLTDRVASHFHNYVTCVHVDDHKGRNYHVTISEGVTGLLCTAVTLVWTLVTDVQVHISGFLFCHVDSFCAVLL